MATATTIGAFPANPNYTAAFTPPTTAFADY